MAHLHRAARLGHLAEVEQEVAQGADVDAVDIHGFVPLMLAAREGHLAVVETLLAAGASVRFVTWSGRTPLHFAASTGHLEIVAWLIEFGAPVDGVTVGKRTPALEAAVWNHPGVVEYLLAHGADGNVRDSQGRTLSELLADGGAFGVQKRQQEAEEIRRKTGWRPPASDKSEAIVARLMAEEPSADVYVAKHGRRTLVWGFGRDQFADPVVDAWVQRVSEILFTPGLLAEVEEAHLTGEEQEEARKIRARRERRRARGDAKRAASGDG